MKYIIFGIPGVGKTSVVNGVKLKTKIRHLHWGDMTFETAKKMGLVTNRDELRILDLETQRRLRVVVAKEMMEISKQEPNVLVETHAAVHTPQGYWPGLSINTLEEFKPDCFIYLYARPEHVFERRLKDDTRWRKDETTIDNVTEALNINRVIVVTYAVLVSGTFIEVENKEGELEYAINTISDLIAKGKLDTPVKRIFGI